MKSQKPRITLRTPSSKNRCNFQFADGRRCRMLRHELSGELCLFHNREYLQLESSEKIGAELLALGGNFQNPIAINFVLGKLFAHVATGRMHRRDASTLAYIAQLLLQTIDEKRYTLARDQFDYRAFTRAIEAKYGRPKPKRAQRTKIPAPRPAATSATPPAKTAHPPAQSPGTPTSQLAPSLTPVSASPLPPQPVQPPPTAIPSGTSIPAAQTQQNQHFRDPLATVANTALTNSLTPVESALPKMTGPRSQ